MADTSDYDGLENQGPDPLSYASATDLHANSSPSHVPTSHQYGHHQPLQDNDDHQDAHHWTHDDDHSNNNNNSPYDLHTTNHANTNSIGAVVGNGPTSHHTSSSSSSNSSSSHIMDNNSIAGFQDGGSSLSMETSGHGRLGREGSADGGSVLPLAEDVEVIDGQASMSKANSKSSSSKNKDANNSSSAESTPRRSASASSPRAKSATGNNPSTPAGRDKMATSADMSMLDMKTSWDGSATSAGGGIKGEDRQNDVAADGATSGGGDDGGCSCRDDKGGESDGNKAQPSAAGVDFTYTKLKYRAGMLADPAKIAKEREREERVRQARERLEGERKKKLEELREQQRLAQENRERQLEMRRQKIEDLRKRDTERRAAVEERRRMKEEIERLRKESILQKAEERVARYEAWRAGGRKDFKTTVANTPQSPSKGNLPGFEGGGTPRHLSVSTSVLYSKRHSDFSSSTALSPANRPESTLALDTIREGRRSFVGRGGLNSSPSASMSSSFHASYSSSATTPAGLQSSPVRMRDRSSPRKPRPASVGTSMPSFVGGEPAKLVPSASRSKSSDRMSRDRSKTRPGRRKDKAVAKDSSAKAKERKEEAEDEKDGGTSTTTKKGRVSLSFFDRLATPKFHRNQDDQKDTYAKKESPIVRVDSNEGDDDDEKQTDDEIDKYMDDPSGLFAKLSPRKSYSTTNLSSIKKKSSFREKTKVESSSTTPRHVTPRRDHSASSPRPSGGSSVSPAPSIMSKSMSAASPRVTPPLTSSTSSSPHPTPSISVTSHGNTAASSSEDGTAAPRGGGVNQDISKEEYKAKMAEKRRQARERAEKEAEEERKRLEEERLAEEERMREEEEEQRRLEVETIRLAEEARKAEEERLQRAIEAEEKRKKEEAERLEQEKKAKEEADRKAKEEAERMEREKQERAKKEEEERMERKKKLEMIMKRVKTDPAQDSSPKMDSPVKSSGSSPNRSALASPDVQEMPPFGQEQENSSGSEDGKQSAMPAPALSENVENSEMVSSSSSEPAPLTPVVRSASSGDIIDSAAEEDKKEMEKGDSLGALNTPVKSSNGTTSEPSSTEVKSRFKSPLLQQLVENKGGSDSPSGTPKFKSPLLQNLLGKTKVGARMGLSASMGDLNLNKGGNAQQQPQQQESSSASMSPAGSTKEISKAGQDEDKDVDESVGSSSASSTSGNDQESFKSQLSPHDDEDHLTNGKSSGSDGDEYGGRYDDATTANTVMTKSSPEFSPMGGMVDSALGSSIEPQQGDAGELSPSGSVMSNGHGAKNKQDAMEDSSISVHTPEEDKTLSGPHVTTFNQFNYQSGQSSSQDETEEEEEDDEGGSSGRFEELIDLPYSSSTGPSKAAVSPIIAFEENSLRTADVGESMS